MQLTDKKWKLELRIRTFEHQFQKCVKGILLWSKMGTEMVSPNTRHWFTFGAKLPLWRFSWLWGLRRSAGEGGSWSCLFPSLLSSLRTCSQSQVQTQVSPICSFWLALHSVPEHLPFFSGFCYLILICMTFLWPWTYNSFSYRLAPPQFTHAFFHPGSQGTCLLGVNNWLIRL